MESNEKNEDVSTLTEEDFIKEETNDDVATLEFEEKKPAEIRVRRFLSPITNFITPHIHFYIDPRGLIAATGTLLCFLMLLLLVDFATMFDASVIFWLGFCATACFYCHWRLGLYDNKWVYYIALVNSFLVIMLGLGIFSTLIEIAGQIDTDKIKLYSEIINTRFMPIWVRTSLLLDFILVCIAVLSVIFLLHESSQKKYGVYQYND
jgi:hypothetical protein